MLPVLLNVVGLVLAFLGALILALRLPPAGPRLGAVLLAIGLFALLLIAIWHAMGVVH